MICQLSGTKISHLKPREEHCKPSKAFVKDFAFESDNLPSDFVKATGVVVKLRGTKPHIVLDARVFPAFSKWKSDLLKLDFGGVQAVTQEVDENGSYWIFKNLAETQHALKFFPQMKFKGFSLAGAFLYQGYSTNKVFVSTAKKTRGPGKGPLRLK